MSTCLLIDPRLMNKTIMSLQAMFMKAKVFSHIKEDVFKFMAVIGNCAFINLHVRYVLILL